MRCDQPMLIMTKPYTMNRARIMHFMQNLSFIRSEMVMHGAQRMPMLLVMLLACSDRPMRDDRRK